MRLIATHTHNTLTHIQRDNHTTISKQNIRAFEMQKLTRLAFFEWKFEFEFEFETRTFYANFACLLTFIAGGGVNEIRGSATQLTIHSRGVAHTHTHVKKG